MVSASTTVIRSVSLRVTPSSTVGELWQYFVPKPCAGGRLFGAQRSPFGAAIAARMERAAKLFQR